jgi:hypothetical protein
MRQIAGITRIAMSESPAGGEVSGPITPNMRGNTNNELAVSASRENRAWVLVKP